jgi:hypothetical protein
MRNLSRASTALTLAALLCLATFGIAAAKGGPSYLRSATISGGGLSSPATTGISIPDQSYEMLPLHAPANGLVATPFELFTLQQTPMTYEVVLHYDYERYGGERDHVGFYDGERLLYFPNSTGGDWYEASPRLGRILRDEVFWGLVPEDARGLRGGPTDPHTREILLVMGLVVLVTVGARVWQGNNEVASPAEVEARMRDRSQPQALIHF